ncbi:MAG: aminotransferase class I/II-fold pyridoxal phosphate-dependent enzyme [Chitinophagaceae bacterium]|nr:aminotransferase class I/II-fold pyridoxal phosphate-dependent enzyme [Chitinophagaceae bacterium]
MITTAKRLDGIGEYYFSQKLREIEALNKSGKNVINLGIGSPDLPPHQDVIKVLQEESAKPGSHAYQGYKGTPALRNAFAQWYKTWYEVDLDPDTEILPLIGSKEGIMHICMTYLNEGDGVLVPNPGYPTYRSAAKLAGGICIDYELTAANAWFPDFEQLNRLVTESISPIRLMFVNYPHMPTGKLPSEELFQQVVSFGKKHHILICHDNPYSFILNDNPMSLLSVEGAKDTVIELNSLSKAQNMAGWRVGLMCGSKQRVEEVLRFKSNMDSGMFLPVQAAAAKALTLGKDWYRQLNTVYKTRRSIVFDLLDLLQCDFDKNQAGMFVWASINDEFKNGYELSDKILNNAGVFITPGGIFGSAGENYIRVSLCSTEQKLQESISRIKQSGR